MNDAKIILEENFDHFGYGYLKTPQEAVPNVPLTFYTFRVMILLGGYFIIFFILSWLWSRKGSIAHRRWFLHLSMWSIALVYIASQCGWIVAEVGRQPWTIQDLLPVSAAVSGVKAGTVQTTFSIFFILFAILLVAEVRIMLRQIKKGPDPISLNNK